MFCLSCVVYIDKTIEELEIERSRDGEKKSFEVGGLNDSTHIDYYQYFIARTTHKKQFKMVAVNRTTKMLSFINHRIRATIVDGRQIVGRFVAFDRHMNLVLADSEEFRKLPKKKKTNTTHERRRR